MWTSAMLPSTLFLLLGFFLTFPFIVRNKCYIIVSSQHQCDSLKSCCTCLTLFSFATNTTNYLQFNTELVFLPGNHTLRSKLIVKHINQLQLYSNTSGSNIFCIDSTARFELTNITHVHISDVKFLGCGGNRAKSVKDFTLINFVFDGQHKYRRKALELVTSIVKTENSSFISNIGGAVNVIQSTATFLNSNFNKNHAPSGGALCGHICSNISVAYSTFYLNSADENGGAIFAQSSTAVRKCMLSILASNFSYNRARKGGAIAAIFTNVSIYISKFISNLASLRGGALFCDKSSMATINRTDF